MAQGEQPVRLAELIGWFNVRPSGVLGLGLGTGRSTPFPISLILFYWTSDRPMGTEYPERPLSAPGLSLPLEVIVSYLLLLLGKLKMVGQRRETDTKLSLPSGVGKVRAFRRRHEVLER